MFLTTMDRHIMGRILGTYVFLVLVLVIFFVLLHYLEYIDDFLDRNAPMRNIYFVYYPSFVPDIIRQVSPLALFLAAIFTTGRLAQSFQIVALQTSGVALQRFMVPYCLIGVFVSVLMFFAGGWIVPNTNQTVLSYDELYINTRTQQLYVSEIHRRNDPTSVVTVGYFDRRTNTAHRVQLQRFSTDGTLTERVDGQQMVWQDSLWHFSYAVIRKFNDGDESRQIIAPLDTVLLVFPRDLARRQRDIESMTIPVATGYVDALRRSGVGDTGRAMIGYYSKFAYPIANLIVMLIALPLACRRRRGGQAVQIGIALLIAFVYLAAQKLIEPFGYTEELNPLLATTLPHALFMCGAIVALVTTRK